MASPLRSVTSRRARPVRGARTGATATAKVVAAKAPTPKKKKPGRDPLLSAICHDLRAPLAAVTMGANFVLQTLSDDASSARQRRILEAMLRSCTQMERLVRNFADLSEIEGDAVNLRIGFHDAGEMLEIAAQTHREAADARHLTLEIDQPTVKITVAVDRDRMLRALGHVVENAIKFAPEGSTVTLSVVQHDGAVTFGVVDRGPGLTAQVKRNLFDRQWHAKRANRVGAGFGLAIARGFAAAHGGRVSVDSRPGQTTFSLTLPIAADENAARGGKREGARQARQARTDANVDTPAKRVSSSTRRRR